MEEIIDCFTGKYRFLSNFFPLRHVLVIDEIEFKTVEHAYQASKTTDQVHRKIISLCGDPRDAKKFGKSVRLRDDWEEKKLEIMEDLVRQKFQNDLELQDLLFNTGDAELIEGNWWGDVFWGVSNGIGENHLGKILMKIRREIQERR